MQLHKLSRGADFSATDSDRPFFATLQPPSAVSNRTITQTCVCRFPQHNKISSCYSNTCAPLIARAPGHFSTPNIPEIRFVLGAHNYFPYRQDTFFPFCLLRAIRAPDLVRVDNQTLRAKGPRKRANATPDISHNVKMRIGTSNFETGVKSTVVPRDILARKGSAGGPRATRYVSKDTMCDGTCHAISSQGNDEESFRTLPQGAGIGTCAWTSAAALIANVI